MGVFNLDAGNHLQSKMFFDETGSVGIARYDTVKYPEIELLTDKQLGFYWRPQEVDLNTDRRDFQKLSTYEKHIFSQNLKRQILLDSVQGRSPSIAFTPITSLPEIEIWTQTWTFFETIHSRSYTHIIREIYSDPTLIFNSIKDNEDIMNCAKDISKSYDELITMSMWYQLLGYGTHNINGQSITVDPYTLKTKLWLALASVNILEGIRFYVSFACSWAFAENKKMEGNAKIIRLIARDENLHLSFTQRMLKHLLLMDDPDFIKIKEETKNQVLSMYKSAIDQEKLWAKYLFKDGSLIGLNDSLLMDYVDYIAYQRMKSIDISDTTVKPINTNPLPWTASWIGSKSVQVAPQETEISSYVTGGIKQDVNIGKLKDFKL